MVYVIIGNGFAGINAIQSIRENDPNEEIILISDVESYSRPLISYFLGKKITESALTYRSRKFFEQLRVSLKIPYRVVSINTNTKTVVLNSGEEIPFDKLLIATGGSPIIPSITGGNTEGVFSFTDVKDAKKIAQYVQNHGVRKATVLGGGLIGLKATDALMELNLEVSIVELSDRILSATFDKHASKIIEGAIQQEGCEVHTNDTIEEILSNENRVSGVFLRSQHLIECEIVIIAIGVRPNLKIIENSPIRFKKGIQVNKYLETSVQDIYAAGDVAEFNQSIIAIIPIAVQQGKIAGYNMSKNSFMENKNFSECIPMNSVILANIPTISVGLTNVSKDNFDYEILESFDSRKEIYRKIILEMDTIVGIIFINDIDRAGIFTGLIKDQINVKSFKDELLKNTFGLISLPRNYRKQKFDEVGIEI